MGENSTASSTFAESFQNGDGAVPAEVKFPEVLSRLIDESPYRTNRRPIWQAIGVSSTALSQYTLGKSRPRIESLVALADFFGVTLDYLVMGREVPRLFSDESRSIMKYVDWTLGHLQSQMGGRASMTARVGDLLAKRISDAVHEAGLVPSGGMLTSDESLLVERHSLETQVLTVLMDHNVMKLENGEAVIGRFGLVVAANLMSSPPRPYRFLLYEQSGRPLVGAAHSLRRLLREELGVPEDRLRYCQFRKTSERVVIGACFYRVDLRELQLAEPGLALLLEEYMTSEGWVGYSINDNSEASQALMDVNRVPAAMATLHEIWQAASPC